jgi:hypothetical protein
LEKEVAVEVETFEDSLSVDINLNTSETILRPREYVDHWIFSFGTKPSSLTLAITLTLSLPKVIISWNLRRGLLLSNALPIGTAFILDFGNFFFFSFLANSHGFHILLFCHVVISCESWLQRMHWHYLPYPPTFWTG